MNDDWLHRFAAANDLRPAGERRFRGALDGVDVEIRDDSTRSARLRMVVVADGTPKDLRIFKAYGEPGTFGDPTLDAVAHVRGGPTLLARLDPEARTAIVRAIDAGASLVGGEWTSNKYRPAAEAVEHAVRASVAASRCLARPVPSLRERVAGETCPGVQRALLVRLRAEEEGLDPDTWLAVAHRVAPLARVIAAEAAGEIGRALLAGLLHDPDVGWEATMALARLPRGPETVLVEDRLIASAETGDIDAILALQEYGSVRVIPALRALTRFGSHDVEAAASGAILVIQDQVDVEPGALSLATAGGELALAPKGDEPQS